MTAPLKLISHKLCPYVQRAVIALTEKGVPFERVDIDLDNKPDWFLKISPLGKTPVLVVGDKAIFESAVILEYLEETQPSPLHPKDPLGARRTSWLDRVQLGGAWATSGASRSQPTKRRLRPRRSSSRPSWPCSRSVSSARHGSTAKTSRWSTRCSARRSATSTSSTRSAISGSLPTSRSSCSGGRALRLGLRSRKPSVRTTTRCCARSCEEGRLPVAARGAQAA